MKMKVEFEGDYIEDDELFKWIIHAGDLHSAVWDARQEIRSRLKYGEGVSNDEERVLEKLQEILYVDGLDW